MLYDMGMAPPKPGMSDDQIDALMNALGDAGSEHLLDEMMKAESGQPPATTSKEIRARMKEIAAKNPELIAKIISAWINEDRRKR